MKIALVVLKTYPAGSDFAARLKAGVEEVVARRFTPDALKRVDSVLGVNILEDDQTFQIVPVSGGEETNTAEVYVPLEEEQLRRAEIVLRQAFPQTIVKPGLGLQVCPQTGSLMGFVLISGQEYPISHQVTAKTIEFILG